MVRHSSDFQLQWKLDFRMNGLNFEKMVDLVHPVRPCPPTKTRYSIEISNPHWETTKFFIKFIEIIHVYFFPLQSLINVFMSTFYFYVNIGNKKCEKLKQILIMPLSVIKICFNGKGLPWDHTKMNRFIYVKNIAVTLWICYKIIVTIVIAIKCAINLQRHPSIGY